MKRADDTKHAATRPQGMFLEVLKQVDLLDKKFDAFMIEVLKKVNTIDEQLRIMVDLSKGVVEPHESAAERDEPVQRNDVLDALDLDITPELRERLEQTQDGGLKLKVGVGKDQFKKDNQEMWANGYKYIPKKGWYPRGFYPR